MQQWIPATEAPLVTIKVGIGFSSSLLVELNRFVATDPSLLEHVTFRVTAERAQHHYQTQPYGVHDTTIRPVAIDEFIDGLIPDLLNESSLVNRNPVFHKTLKLAYERSRLPMDNEASPNIEDDLNRIRPLT